MSGKKELTYLESVHRDGRAWGLLLFFLILFFPFGVAVIFQAWPNWGALARGTLAILPMYWAVGIVEIFTDVYKRQGLRRHDSLTGGGPVREADRGLQPRNHVPGREDGEAPGR